MPAQSLQMVKLDPSPIRSLGDLAGIPTIPGEYSMVPGPVEMNRPLVRRHVVSNAVAGCYLVAREEVNLAFGKLPVGPDRLAIGGPELVAGDLHAHRAF